MKETTSRKKSSGPGFTEGPPVNYKLQFMGKGSYVPERQNKKVKHENDSRPTRRAAMERHCIATNHL